jgi:hypothetical protein
MVVSDQAPPRFSRDGLRLFVGTSPPPAPPAPEGAPAPRGVDLWHWQDPLLQPMQRVRAQQERNRNYRAVVHLADKRFVQLATPDYPTVAQGEDSARAWARRSGGVALNDGVGRLQAIPAPAGADDRRGTVSLYFDEYEADWFTYRSRRRK